jgi:hypothetical protein
MDASGSRHTAQNLVFQFHEYGRGAGSRLCQRNFLLKYEPALFHDQDTVSKKVYLYSIDNEPPDFAPREETGRFRSTVNRRRFCTSSPESRGGVAG